MKDDEIRKTVRESYAKIAVKGRPGNSTVTADRTETKETTVNASCCAPQQSADNTCGCDTGSERFDYSAEQLSAIPAGADLGLGCGNPTVLASLAEGEVVLDLGSGGGVDCFIAAKQGW